MQPSFSAGGDVASDEAEVLGTSLSPKATGYFLLHLIHAKISFTLIISKRSLLLNHKAEGFLLKSYESLKKISGFRLCTLVFILRTLFVGGFQDVAICFLILLYLLFGELPAGVIYGSVYLFKEYLHSLRPFLRVLLYGPFKLTQMMCVAKDVSAEI